MQGRRFCSKSFGNIRRCRQNSIEKASNIAIKPLRKSSRIKSTVQSAKSLPISNSTTQQKGSKPRAVEKSKNSQLNKPFHTNNYIYTELNHKEKWSKKKTKRSVYTRPSPHWDLITNINKRVKLGFLTNGNLSKTAHRVNGVTFAVGNTCCFVGSIAQVMFTTIIRFTTPTLYDY